MVEEEAVGSDLRRLLDKTSFADCCSSSALWKDTTCIQSTLRNDTSHVQIEAHSDSSAISQLRVHLHVAPMSFTRDVAVVK